jgi:hypothetical protein
MEQNTMKSQDVAEPDEMVSGTAGTGQENEELEWARRHVPPDPYLVVRKTEIIGWGVKPSYKVRRKTKRRPRGEDSE